MKTRTTKRVYWRVENLSKQLKYLPSCEDVECRMRYGVAKQGEEPHSCLDTLYRDNVILRQG
jgi:hypothetical protein